MQHTVKSGLWSSQSRGKMENDVSLKSEHKLCRENKLVKYLQISGNTQKGLLNVVHVFDIVVWVHFTFFFPFGLLYSGNTKSRSTSVMREQL